MEKRPYGPKKELLSILGFGGILVTNMPQTEADVLVAEAIDAGVNYFDVAPTYGNAQSILGPALLGKRQKIFLACKTEQRKRTEAEAALEESFRLLKTDYFDLYQLHGVTTIEDVETCFAPGGAMEVLLRAKEQGKVRYLGVSAHSDDAAIACLERYPFDSVLFPLNWNTWLNEGYGKPLVAEAQQRGVSLLALKAMAECSWPNDLPSEARPYKKTWYRPLEDPDRIALALRFTLSLPIVSALTPGEANLFRIALDRMISDAPFRPLSDEEMTRIKSWPRGEGAIFKAV